MRTRRSPQADAIDLCVERSADHSLDFVQAVERQSNGALIRCEQRYPSEGPHSVLYVVVDRDVAHWREKLTALHQDYFSVGQTDPHCPVRLEVLDRATDETLARLIELGLVSNTARAIRPLFPPDLTHTQSPLLSDTERQQAESRRHQATRKLKLAGILGDSGFEEEARSALLQAVFPLACALAIENRLPEPEHLEQALLPPLAGAWGDALIAVRDFVRTPRAAWKLAAERLKLLLAGPRMV